MVRDLRRCRADMGDGLPPCEFDKVVGRTTLCELKADDNLSFEVLGGDATWPSAAAWAWCL